MNNENPTPETLGVWAQNAMPHFATPKTLNPTAPYDLEKNTLRLKHPLSTTKPKTLGPLQTPNPKTQSPDLVLRSMPDLGAGAHPT